MLGKLVSVLFRVGFLPRCFFCLPLFEDETELSPPYSDSECFRGDKGDVGGEKVVVEDDEDEDEPFSTNEGSLSAVWEDASLGDDKGDFDVPRV